MDGLQSNCGSDKKKHSARSNNYIFSRVGKGAPNSIIDIKTVITLLNLRKKDPYYQKKLSRLVIPKSCSNDILGLIDCITEFQRIIQGAAKADGIVGPTGNTILHLGGVKRIGKQIIIDMDDQKLHAYDGIKKSYSFHCATGDKDHPTAIKPSLHHVFRKYEKYRSRTYNAQMNYAMFFTNDGKAIHQSNAVMATSFLKVVGIDSLGSHGCVRLSEYDAKLLFNWAPMNTPVFIDMA